MTLEIKLGDCFELIKQQTDNSVDLVITSPPYSDIVNYGKEVSTKKPDDYVDWLLPLFNEIYRVLKPSGSFILNINDKTEKGLRSTYIYDLISRNNKETKLKLYDTYIWHKKNGIPNGANKRFRNMTEFIFHFVKDSKQLKFYMDRVLEEPTESSKSRLNYDLATQGQTINGVRIKEKDRIKIDLVRPDNVFRFSTAGASRDNLIKHPAPFHKDIPLYFINLLTDENDLVIDPFSGIGTTGIACKELNRDYIGYELNETYVDFSEKRLNDLELNKMFVNKYDLQGNFIESYENRTQAYKNNPECSSEEDIMRCWRGKRKTCGGFIWKLENLKKKFKK
jgi:site-specific DNA-methyltransferase (adenine-specific)